MARSTVDGLNVRTRRTADLTAGHAGVQAEVARHATDRRGPARPRLGRLRGAPARQAPVTRPRSGSRRTTSSAGTSLRPSDLIKRDVRLESVAGSYLSASGAVPVGYVLARSVASGELVPAAAVTAASTAPDRRLVTVPVERFHRPGDLRHGLRVDVYVTLTPSGGTASTSLVLASATVEDVLNDGGRFGPTGDSMGVVLRVSPADVPALVAASRSGTLDLVAAG